MADECDSDPREENEAKRLAAEAILLLLIYRDGGRMSDAESQDQETTPQPPVESFDQAIQKLDAQSSHNGKDIAQLTEEKIETVENILNFPDRVRSFFLRVKKRPLLMAGLAVSVTSAAVLTAFVVKNRRGQSKRSSHHG